MIEQGITFEYKGVAAIVVRHLPTEFGSGLSTFVEVEIGNGSVILHENTISSILNGTYVADAPKGKRNVRTKKERAADHVAKMVKQDLSRSEIIKELSNKLRVSRASAQTYYYTVR